MFRLLHRLSWLALSLMFCGLPAAVHADELRVAVASNFAGVLEQLGQRFTAATGHELSLSPGASGAQYTQIINGAPFELFFSADEERPQSLRKEGYAKGAGVGVYALGKLVLWSSNAALVDAKGAVLRNGDYRRLSIANPSLAPYGLAAQETLQNLGVWDTVQSKLVQGENITQALQFIESGNAELGFIAASQYVALPAGSKGSAWQVPADLHTPIRQAYIVLSDAPAAQALVDFLGTAEARTLIEQSGYNLP